MIAAVVIIAALWVTCDAIVYGPLARSLTQEDE